MKYRINVRICIIVAALVVRCYGGEKLDGSAILARARALSNLHSAGTPPFRLRATVAFPLRNIFRGQGGTYTEFWSGHDTWREEAVTSSFTEIRIGTGDKVWRGVNTSTATAALFDTMFRFSPVYVLRLQPGETIGKVRQKRRESMIMNCVQVLRGPYQERELCLDSLRGVLLSEEGVSRVRESLGGAPVMTPNLRFTSEYSEYVSLGERLYPKTIRITQNGEIARLVSVDSLEPTADLNPSLFAPPPDTEAWPWCDDFVGPAPVPELRVPYTPATAAIFGSAVQVVVGPSGMPLRVTVLRAPKKGDDRRIGDYFRQQHFQPATCGTRPVTGEYIIEVPSL